MESKNQKYSRVIQPDSETLNRAKEKIEVFEREEKIFRDAYNNEWDEIIQKKIDDKKPYFISEFIFIFFFMATITSQFILILLEQYSLSLILSLVGPEFIFAWSAYKCFSQSKEIDKKYKGRQDQLKNKYDEEARKKECYVDYSYRYYKYYSYRAFLMDGIAFLKVDFHTKWKSPISILGQNEDYVHRIYEGWENQSYEIAFEKDEWDQVRKANEIIWIAVDPDPNLLKILTEC